MTEPSEWALREATMMVARWDHGSDEHRQWLRDMCIPEVALALDAARRKGIEGAAEPSPWVAAISSLREPNPELEEAVAAAMMRVQSNRGWDDAPAPLRKIWCEAARQVIDALVDAALKEGMQNANPG